MTESALKLPHEDKLKSVIQRDCAGLFDANTQLFLCALSLIPKSLGHLPTGMDYQKHVFMLMLSKSAKTFRAMNLLVSHGLDSDAMILLRTLVELRVILRFILAQDSEERAHRFVTRANVVNRYRRALAFGHDPECEDTKLWAEVQKARQAFGDKWWEGVLKGSPWSGKRISKMAEDVQLQRLYRQVYAKACEASHGSDAADHVTRTDKGGFCVQVMPSSEWANYDLAVGNTVFSDILLNLNSAMRLTNMKGCEAIIRKYRIPEDD